MEEGFGVYRKPANTEAPNTVKSPATLGNGFPDTEQPEDEFGNDVSEDSREDDDGDRDGFHAAQFFGEIHADGGSNGFRKQCHILPMVQGKQFCQ